MIERIVSEGIEVWVSWLGVKKFCLKGIDKQRLVVEKRKAEEARDVVIQCNAKEKGGKRGKGDD